MNLLIDIGNQFIKWCYGDTYGRFPLECKHLDSHYHQHWGSLPNVSGVTFVNVARVEISVHLNDFCHQNWNVEPYELKSSSSCCGVKNNYTGADGPGADRWAAAIGAWSIVKSAAIMVDCGTAITVDGLSHRGEYIGGSIMPGLFLARESLSKRTSRIGEFQNVPLKFPGRNTAEGACSGIHYGTAGGIDILVDKYLELLGDAVHLLITGGDALKLSGLTKHHFEHYPHLVLQGLAEVARINSVSA